MAHQESNGDPRRWESNVFHNNDADGHRGRFIIISGGYRVQVWDATSWEDAPMTWVENNHYIPDLPADSVNCIRSKHCVKTNNHNQTEWKAWACRPIYLYCLPTDWGPICLRKILQNTD
jgi:hypothetical protein